MCGKIKEKFCLILSILITFAVSCSSKDYQARFRNHQVPYNFRHESAKLNKCDDKEKDYEVSNQFAQTFTHESMKNSKIEQPSYEEEMTNQKNEEEEDYSNKKSKFSRSLDYKEDEKCGDGGGENRKNDYMNSWSSGSGGSMKKTTNIALKAAQEAKAAEEGKTHFAPRLLKFNFL
jgi:hypothetical protein